MALQNRVDPWGNLVAVEARGAWFGNRGILHNEHKEIVSPWRHKAWITCLLEFKGRKREIFSKGKYSELFFLDEATAFSAGHRPCGECRRERYKAFKAAWIAANIGSEPVKMSVAEIDKQLHTERAAWGGRKVTYQEAFANLPSGTFIEWHDEALLYWQGQLKKWSFTGYSEVHTPPDPQELVTVLTPKSIVQMYRHGFAPQVHESAYQTSHL